MAKAAFNKLITLSLFFASTSCHCLTISLGIAAIVLKMAQVYVQNPTWFLGAFLPATERRFCAKTTYFQVVQDLNRYSVSDDYRFDDGFGWWWWYPRPSGANDATDVFNVS